MKTEAAVSRPGTPHPVIETLDLEAPRPGEVLVRVVASGICHTDLNAHASRGGSGALTPKPVVLGHEGAGIVEAVGVGVRTLKPGDHVVMSGGSCGVCPSCRKNLPSYCYEVMPRSFGGSRMDGSTALSKDGEPIHGHFFNQSSFSRWAITDERTAVKVADDIPLDIVAPMGCGVMAARIVGASRIIAVDVIPERLALARELGATDTVDSRADDPARAIKDITGHGVSCSFNTTQVPDIWTAALDCLAMQGTAGFVTAPRGPWAPGIYPMLTGGRTLKGIIGGDAAPQTFIPMLIDYWRQGRFPVDRLIEFYPFEEIGRAFEDTEAGRTIKPVLRMAA